MSLRKYFPLVFLAVLITACAPIPTHEASAPQTAGIAYALIGAGGVLLLVAVIGAVLTSRRRPGGAPAPVQGGVQAQTFVPPSAVAPASSLEDTIPAAVSTPAANAIPPQVITLAPQPADSVPAQGGFCKNCGAALATGAVFCPKCGARR